MSTNDKIKILLANDHKIIREGLRSLFESHSDMEVLDGELDSKSVVQIATFQRHNDTMYSRCFSAQKNTIVLYLLGMWHSVL